MAPRKEAHQLESKDILIERGKAHEIKQVKDFGNRIVVVMKDGTERRFNVGDEVEVQ